MPPRASRRVAAAAAAATAAPPAANKKRARGAATAEEAGSDAAEAHSSSSEERPTRRARGDSGHNELGSVPSPSAGAATADGSPDPAAATATGRRSRSRQPAAAASASAPIPQRAKGKKAGGAGADIAAVALGDPLLAPVRRCDPDSLSLVFAMLNTADFLAAIRVCKGWRATRMKHSAWPTLHLPSFIQSLRDDDYDNPARRRLEVRLMHKAQSPLEALFVGTPVESTGSAAVGAPSVDADGASSSSDAAAAAAPAASPSPPSTSASMWRHATDMKLLVKMNSFDSVGALEAACDRALRQIAQLPYLSALNLHDCAASDAAVRDFFSAVAGRLQALLMFGDWQHSWQSMALWSHLPLLHGLRVLVLNQQPPLPVLAQLTQLRYLHFSRSHQVDERLTRTLRWLSQVHQLRSLSLNQFDRFTAGLGLLFQPPVATDQGATHALPTAVAADEGATFGASASSTKAGHLSAGDAGGGGSAAAPVAGAAAGGDSGPVVDWSRPCCLTDVSLAGRVTTNDLDWLGRLPHLRRLQVESHVEQWWEQPPAHPAVLSRLEQLRLCLRRDPNRRRGVDALPLDWSHLQAATQLRVLQLTSAHVEEVPAATLLAVVAACAATLEELRIGNGIRIIHAAEEEQHAASVSASASASGAAPAAVAAPASAAVSAPAASAADADGADASAAASVAADSGTGAAAAATSEAPAAASPQLGPWSSLSRCPRLRVLQLELQSGTAGSGVLVALSLLPAFQSLELTLRGKQRDGWPAHGLVLPPALMRCIAQSRSWCSLHIHAASDRSIDLLRTAGGLAAQMPAEHADDATARRLRVYSHGKGGGEVRSYGIRDDGRSGGRQWQLL